MTNYEKYMSGDGVEHACSYCEYITKNGTEEPCASCSHNYLSKFRIREKKTRQSEFLKLFPSAEKRLIGDTEIIAITPCTLVKKTNLEAGHCAPYNKNRCLECMKEYWLKEVE